MEMISGKTPAIYNGHQPPRAIDPYVFIKEIVSFEYFLPPWAGQAFSMTALATDFY